MTATLADAHYVDCDILADTRATWDDDRGQVRDLYYPGSWSHLEGETVAVVGDGAYLGTEAVSSGVVALDDDTTTNHVGLIYTSTLQPSKLDLEQMGIAWIKKIVMAIVSFYQTLGGKAGDSSEDLTPIIFRDRDDEFGSSHGLTTETLELPLDTDYEREGNFTIVQDQPLPMTVRGIILPIGVYDDSE